MINIKIPKNELTKLIKNRVSGGITLKNRPIRIPPTKIVPEDATVEKYNRDFQNWDKTNIRLLKSVFVQSENEYLTDYVEATHNGSNLLTTIKETLQLKIKALTDLMDAIPLFQEEKSSKQENSSETNINLDMRKVFIVHGHNEGIKEKVARIIERLGLTPIILHEQVNHGRTIIEKLETISDEAGFAIMLLTADDLGRAKEESNEHARARQNVIFEMGYFMGKLGRERVFVLLDDGVEKPSDIDGIVYTAINSNWQLTLVQELNKCGYNVDANKLI